MKRQTPSQSRGNIPPRINTPNNHEFIQDYYTTNHQPFSPAKNVDNNMYNNMYYPNNQMIPQNNGPMYNNAVDSIDNYELNDNSNNKKKWEMNRGMTTPTTPIHHMNEMNQFNIPVPFRNGYEMYGDPQQQLMTQPPPYMRSNGPFMNGGHRGNEEMMVGMNHVMKDQNNNLLSPVVMENTGGAQNNKKANLYKTELCRSFEETGQCRYGSKCQFAHSESELRHVDRHPKYKTEMCKTFWEQGTCPYGKRCCFIHTPRDLAKKEDIPGHTPTTPAKSNDKKVFQDVTPTFNMTKKKENSIDNVNNNLSEGETTAITSEEGETTANNRSRSGSDSATAASITEEIISNDEQESKDNKNEKIVDKKIEENKEKPKSENKKDGSDKTEAKSVTEKSQSGNTPAVAVPIKTSNKVYNGKGMASSFEPMAKTPTNQSFNYSTSFGGSMNMMGNPLNNGYVPHRKMSSPPQRQNPRLNNTAKSLSLNVDINNNKYNNVLGMNSMSFNPTSPLDSDFMFNNNHGEMNGKIMGMSTSLPTNDIIDEKIMYKLQNLHIQTTPPHTPINQRANQNNQNMMNSLSSSFNQNNIFMKQPLMINTTQNNSNLFLKQTTASPYTPSTPNSFLSPKQTHVGLPTLPLIDDETPSLKGSVSGKGSDFGDDASNVTEEIINTPSTPNNNLFVKQAINTSKTGTPHSFLKVSQKPTTPKNPSMIPSTPQSISNGFLNNGSVSPLQSRMGTSLPTTPIHPNKFNPSAIDEVFSGNNNIINDFSRTTSSGINVAASPFTPTNDLSQYMMQMSSARENSIQSLENIKSPSQLFYRPTSGSINAINTTPSMKSNGGFNMNMGGIGMPKNRSESFDYGMLSPNGMNSFLSGSNPISSPVNTYNNSLASSFTNSFLNSKVRSESVDFGQVNNFNKENMVGSMPTFSFLQSINEGVPDSPFSNHGSIHGSPLPSSTTTLNDMTSGMSDFIGVGRRKSFQDSSLMSSRLPTVPEGKHPNTMEEEDERLFSNNNLTDEGILKFSKEHFGLDDDHSKSLLGNQGSNAMDIKGSILGGNIFSSISPSSTTHNFF